MNNLRLPPNIEAQAYLAAIITSSDDAIISKDMNGNITSWNPSAERIFGYTAKEAVGKHISLIIPQDKFTEEDYIIGQVRQGNRIDHFETKRRAKNGALIDISVTVSPIRSKEGTIIGASKVARDISSFKQAERASAYLGAIIESSEDAIVSKDLSGFITSWNKSAERIFGYPASEAVGRHITLIIPSDRLGEEDKIIATLKAGERVDHFETLRRHKVGRMVSVSVTVSPIKDSSGKIVGASKVARDISDRVNAQRALDESNRKKDEFIANMSHELRTPMNAVIGLAGLLKTMPGLPEKATKFIDTLKISADNLLELINDLLDFAKIEAGSVELEEIEFSLAEQIENIISVSNVRAHEKGLALYVNYATSLNRHYLGDPLRIHQVLINILSNAIKFTENGSIEVSINAESQPDSEKTLIAFRVSDTGIGIAEDKLETIFDKFSQADSSITRRFGGSGLGLAICKALIEKMNGSISVDSQVGVGSNFIVKIPLRNSQNLSSVERFSLNSIPAVLSGKKNVLLVEDYEPNILVAEAILEQLGYNFDVARNGFEAMRKFAHGRFDVVLMDVQMHEMDGLDATRRIRRMEAEKGLGHTPIIALTAHVRERDKDKCLDAGMDDFLPKPFDPHILAQKIDRYIHADNNREEIGSNDK